MLALTAILAFAPMAKADTKQLTLCWAAWDPANALVELMNTLGIVIDIDGQTIQLKQGEWTKWIDLTFKVNMIVRVHGMVQMLLMNAGSELQLYISPVNWKPGEDVIIAGSVSDEDAKKTYPNGWKAPKPYIRIVPQPK